MVDFMGFPKIPRLYRECLITEKIDGTNAQIVIEGDSILAASRSQWITPDKDNFGFAKWVMENADDLRKLGEGRHFGEWYGQGIQRKYGLSEKRFSLFNTTRWGDPDSRPTCCSIVPELYRGPYSDVAVQHTLDKLRREGSKAVPGYMNPEGVVVFMCSSSTNYKVLLENDGLAKGQDQCVS